MTQFETDVNKCFAGVIGQPKAKRMLINSVMSAHHGGLLRSIAFYGPKGNGKTHLKNAYAEALKLMKFSTKIVQPKTFRKVDSTDWAEIKMMLSGDSYYLGLDEIHDLWASDSTIQLKKIDQFLMRGLDGTFKGGHFALSDDFMAYFDRKKCSVTIASNRMGEVPEALRDRFEPATLELYTENQLVDILQLMLQSAGLHANEDSLGMIARCGRGTARPMERIVRTLEINLKAESPDKKTINKEEIFQALKENEMYPRGLSKPEVMMLRDLRGKRMTERQLKPRLQVDSKTLNEHIGFLLSIDLLDDGSHRGLETNARGVKYLDSIAELGFTVPRR